MCVLSIKVPIRKKSGKLFNDPCIYIYIYIKKWINGALNCETYSSLEGVSYYHRIVTAKMCLNLCRNTIQTTKTTHYALLSLNNRDIINEYMITLRNKFYTLPEISEKLFPNDKYENFVNTHMEAAAECIPTKVRAKHSSLGDISSWEKPRQRENIIPM